MRTPLLSVLLISASALAQSAAPAPKTQLTWLGHAAFELVTKTGTIVLVDPWLGNPKYPADRPKPEKADVILVTHGHGDHLGDTIALAAKTNATVVGSYELVAWAKSQGVKNAVDLNSGSTHVVKDVTVYVVDAVHSSGIADKTGAPTIYGGAPLGYVIAPEGGPRIYHSGDTNVFPGMQLTGELYKPDLALLCIGGHYTMGPREAAMAVKLLKAKKVLPMHWGTFPILAGTPDQLKAELKAMKVSAEVLTPKPGETLSF